MDFVANKLPQIEEMLKTIGIASVEELFASIPAQLRHSPPSNDDGRSESEVSRYFESIAQENTYSNYLSFLGAGAYNHQIPAMVAPIVSRSEFLTSYTPYQPEMSQGILQALFEYQSCMAALTGMEVSNAGVYDGASACSEGLLMSLRINPERNKVITLECIHPNYLKVIKQILAHKDVILKVLPLNSSPQSVALEIDEQTAGFLFQSPDFFGKIETYSEAVRAAHEKGVTIIQCGNPLSYALFTPPGEASVDIAVGDCQPLGLPLQFGGPYAGYMTCRSEITRQLPGRLIGETLDKEGRRGFVLTLQAREQHIRREKATSNICTSQSLANIASLISLLWYGPKGLRELALTNYQRASYLAAKLCEFKGFSVTTPFFNEFTLHCPCEVESLYKALFAENIIAGIPLSRYFPSLDRHLLLSVTEMHSKRDLDLLVDNLRRLT